MMAKLFKGGAVFLIATFPIPPIASQTSLDPFHTAPEDHAAECRSRYQCDRNPYGHDYQGTACRIRLQQCLELNPVKDGKRAK